MKIMAVDYGDARTGLAVCDRTEFLASPVGTIEEKSFAKVAEKIVYATREFDVGMVVIGLPKNMDGTEGARAEKSRKLADTLRAILPIPVELWDERQTTIAAANILSENGTYGKIAKKSAGFRGGHGHFRKLFGVSKKQRQTRLSGALLRRGKKRRAVLQNRTPFFAGMPRRGACRRSAILLFQQGQYFLGRIVYQFAQRLWRQARHLHAAFGGRHQHLDGGALRNGRSHGGGALAQHAVGHNKAQGPGNHLGARGVYRGGIFAGGPGAGPRLQHGRGGKRVCAHGKHLAGVPLGAQGLNDGPAKAAALAVYHNKFQFRFPFLRHAAPPHIKGANSRRNICASHLYSGTRRISSAVTSWHMAMVASKSSLTRFTICPPKNWQQFS